MSRNPRVAMCALFVVGSWTPSARADPPPSSAQDPVAAEALFREGRRRLDAGDVAAACGMFAESHRLDPAVGTLLNLANCEERLGRISSAWEHFRRAIELLPRSDRRVRVARERVTALEPRLPRLTITAALPLGDDATVLRDGVALGTASLGVAMPLDPGAHTVVVRAPGRRDATFEVTLVERDARSVEVALGEPVSGTDTGPAASDRAPRPREVAPTPTPNPAPASSGPLRPLGIVTVGIGGAALATGAVTGLLVLGRASVVNDPDHCDADLRCDQEGVDAARSGSALATISTISFVAGGVVAAAGIVMLLVPSEPERPTSPRVQVRPEVAAFEGLVVEGTF